MTPDQASQHQPATRVSLLRGWQLATLALGILATALMALGWAYAPRAFASQGLASLGYNAAAAHFGTLAARRIVSFERGSPLPTVGVQLRDLIIDPPRGAWLAGETLQIRVAHGNTIRNLEISGERVDWLSSPGKNALGFFPCTLLLVLGLIIGLRKRHEIAALALASALFFAAMTVPNFLPAGRLAAVVDVFGNVCSPLVFAAFVYFFLTFEGGYSGRTRTSILRTLLGFSAAWIAWSIVMIVPYTLGRVWFTATDLIYPVLAVADIAVLALCGLALGDRWRHAGPAPRQKLRWLFLSFMLACLGFILSPVLVLLQTSTGHWTGTPPLAFAIAQNIAYDCAALSLSYVILRYRVIDVGFVISRAFVFAVLTGLLLLGFGIAEWLMQRLVHFEGEKSVLLDGAVAVGVFVAVHRGRDWIERAIERVFFRASHERESALQHFLDVAPHFSEPKALSSALLAAADAYSGSHGSGIYERGDSGRFVLETSTSSQLPPELGPDTEAVLELKTLRKSHHFARLASGSPVLALPVVRQTELVGFLAVTEKIDRTVYRADETENLARAAREVGFDLYALRLEQVEQRGRQLEQQNEALREGLRSLMLIARGVERPTDAQRTP